MKEDRDDPQMSPMDAARDAWSRRRDIADQIREDVPRVPERWRSLDRSARVTVLAGVGMILAIIVLQFV